jgi:hypothetical protein
MDRRKSSKEVLEKLKLEPLHLIINRECSLEIATFLLFEFERSCEKSKRNLTLQKLLESTNPFMLLSNPSNIAEVVKSTYYAFLNKSRQTKFGQSFTEPLVCSLFEQNGGMKSVVPGSIDIEYIKNNIRYLIEVKSSPKWGNGSSVAKMEEDFKRSIKIFEQNPRNNIKPICINGCIYGHAASTKKSLYYKLIGQDFWYFLTGKFSDVKWIFNIIKDASMALCIEETRDSDILLSLYQEFLREICTNGIIDEEKLMNFIGWSPDD